MKKLLASIGVILLLASIIFVACKKEKESCKTCKTAKAKSIRGNYNGTQIIAGSYASSDIGFITKKVVDRKEIDDLIASVNSDGLAGFSSQYNPIAVVLFYAETIDDGFTIDNNKVKGYMLYYSNGNSMFTAMYKKENGNEIFDPFFSTSTNYCTSNDIARIAKKRFDNEVNSTISFVRFDQLNNINNNVSELQARTLYATTFEQSRFNPSDILIGAGCNFPCDEDPKGICTAKEDQMGREKWTCFPNPCAYDRMSPYVADNNEYGHQHTLLTTFRDNYLATKKKGLYFISLYNFLSNKADKSGLTASFVTSTMDVIVNHISPIINKLSSKNDFNEILYNANSRDAILEYLDQSKTLFSDSYSLDKIEELKNEIILNANKTVSDVNLYLSGS